MRDAVLGGLIVFVGVFGLLRAVEYMYHRLKHTVDWSPHWGSWVFALLAGLYVVATNLGR